MDDDVLATALERPFEPERTAVERILAGPGPDASATAAGQGVMLRELGRDEATRGGRATAVAAVQRVLDRRPPGQPERPALATEAAFGIFSAEGPVPGFEEYAASQADSGFDQDDLVVLFRRDGLDDTPTSFREDFEALETELLEIEERQRG